MTPPTLKNWIWINLKIGALSFGSGGRALLYEQAVVTEKGWLGEDEFREIFTVTQILPGPNLMNLSSYLGFRLCGPLGGLLGLLFLAIPGSLLLVSTYALLNLANPAWNAFFRGVSIGSIILFFHLIEKNIQGLKQSEVGNIPATKAKRILRGLVAALSTGLFLVGGPFLPKLALGALLGLVLEFSLRKKS
jgi:chromate transporter